MGITISSTKRKKPPGASGSPGESHSRPQHIPNVFLQGLDRLYTGLYRIYGFGLRGGSPNSGYFWQVTIVRIVMFWVYIVGPPISAKLAWKLRRSQGSRGALGVGMSGSGFVGSRVAFST